MTKGLQSSPTKEKTNSELNNEEILKKDYRPAQKVWNSFNIKDLGEYQGEYNIIDVLLLSDVVENVRKFTQKI